MVLKNRRSRLFAAMLATAVTFQGLVQPLAFVAAAGVVLKPVAARADGPVGGLYTTTPSGGSVGAILWNAPGSSVPGSPGNGGGCPPAIQAAHGAGYAAGVQNALSISKAEHPAPGKILTGCITALINMMSTFDIFSNAGPFAISAIINAVVSYAESAICGAIADQFNALVSRAFNSLGFLTDIIPCGVSVSMPFGSGGGGGMNFCSSLGGPLVNVGVQGGHVYTLGSGSIIPPAISGVMGIEGGGGTGYNPLSVFHGH